MTSPNTPRSWSNRLIPAIRSSCGTPTPETRVAAEDVTLKPFQRALVPTGMAIALPAGYVALVHPRSGLAVKYGVTVLNAPGTIDAGYRGEVKVPLINLDPEHTMEFHRGDRIAQLVIQRYVEAKFVPASTLPGSDRAERGFGSTGVSS